jgi:AcrR family transcriptional regulator
LQQIASRAPLYYPVDLRADQIAAHLCDTLLHGLIIDPPPEPELAAAPAHQAALAAIAGWHTSNRAAPGGASDDILAAARGEFARRGYEATTIRDISRAAGIGMATLYRRVDSKETLLRTIIDEYARCLDQAFGAVMSAQSTESERLYALMRVFGHASRRFCQESRIVAFGWFGREAESSPVHDYFIATQQRLSAQAALIHHGVEAGALRPIAAPAELAVHLRSVLWLRFHEHARTSEDRAFSFLAQSLLRGALADSAASQ